jgi:type IV pilus assembly protein PilM
MLEKPDAYHAMGIEFHSQGIKAIKLSMRKGQPFLEYCEEMSMGSPATDQSPSSAMPSESLRHALVKSLVVTTLHTHEVLVRQLEVKLKRENDIDAVLNFQAEPLLPYPAEQALVDRIRIGDTPDGTLLTVFAARKDHLQQHLNLAHQFEIEPEVVGATPLALATFAALFSPTEQPYYVVHLGHTQTTCLLMRDGKLIAAQACFQGIERLIQAHQSSSLSQTPLSELELNSLTPEQAPLLLEALDLLRMEVKRTLYALTKSLKGQEVDHLLFTGEGATLQSLPPYLSQPFNIPFHAPTPHPHFNLTPTELQKWAIPIGAALTALPNKEEQVNFRQQEFAYPYPWRRYKKPVIIYLSACIALAFALYFAGVAYVKHQEDGVRRQYAELLAFLNKPYVDFEREFESKLTPQSTSEEKILAIESLNMQAIEDRLKYLEKELQTVHNSYPLFPQIPTVSDVLAWLATHPNVVSYDPDTSTPIPLLQIESFNYSLVKRPEQTKQQEKYQAKVEMEFSSPTPKLAREFHDALIAPNPLIDPKGDVKWSTNRGLYRTSFMLKDKTVYPRP